MERQSKGPPNNRMKLTSAAGPMERRLQLIRVLCVHDGGTGAKCRSDEESPAEVE